MLAELLGLLADLLAAERLVEQARAVGLQHPEVEAEEPLAHEVAGAGAPPPPAPPPPLGGPQPAERGDLRLEAPGGVARPPPPRRHPDAPRRPPRHPRG